MSVTPQGFQYHLKQLADTEKYLIAYSGGVDSHVLLHLCAQIKNSPYGSEQSFSAVYIDHGLSYDSKKWGKHCQHICFELDIPLTIIEVNAQPEPGQSPEAAARIARYRALSELLAEQECLLTAQHIDDQAETLLLQLLRGSGAKGLSSMPRAKPFGKGTLCRPMLDYKRHEIMTYAKHHQLEWIEDESNAELRYDRNYLRHKILPRLTERWPSVQENFAKSAELLAETQSLLEEMAEKDMVPMQYVNHQGEFEPDKLKLAPIMKMLSEQSLAVKNVRFHCHNRTHARINNILRHWIHCNHLPLPSKKILEQVVMSVILARNDATPVVKWRRDHFYCEVRKYRNVLYLINASPRVEKNGEHRSNELQAAEQEPSATRIKPSATRREPLALINEPYELKENQPLKIHQLQGIIQLSKTSETQQAIAYGRERLLSKPLTVRFRKGGERFRREPDSHSQQLKHWFQTQGIPPWERDNLPLFYWGEELIQAGNEILNHSLTDQTDKNAMIIQWVNKDLDEITDKKR